MFLGVCVGGGIVLSQSKVSTYRYLIGIYQMVSFLYNYFSLGNLSQGDNHSWALNFMYNIIHLRVIYNIEKLKTTSKDSVMEKQLNCSQGHWKI